MLNLILHSSFYYWRINSQHCIMLEWYTKDNSLICSVVTWVLQFTVVSCWDEVVCANLSLELMTGSNPFFFFLQLTSVKLTIFSHLFSYVFFSSWFSWSFVVLTFFYSFYLESLTSVWNLILKLSSRPLLQHLMKNIMHRKTNCFCDHL